MSETDLSAVFPDVTKTEESPPDDMLTANTQKATFDAAVKAEVERHLAARGMSDTPNTYQEAEGPKQIARDHITGDHYGGIVSQELAQAVADGEGKPVMAVQRSIIKNKFGERANVWFPAPVSDGVSPVPGEHRWIVLEELSE